MSHPTKESPRVSLDGARAELAGAERDLSVWHRGDGPGRVRAGHGVIGHIDAAVRALYAARAALLGELRADEVDRAERVDELLARVRAERSGMVYEREDPETDPRPSPPHEGYPLGGRRPAGDPDAATRPLPRLLRRGAWAGVNDKREGSGR